MQTGDYYEARAADLLQAAGLALLERNYRCKVGEIDIICRDKTTIVFVEVRFRRNRHFASAAASVTISKQRKLIRTAQFFLQRRGWTNSQPCRFDVVAISRPRAGNKDEIQWLRNAFTM